MALIVHLLFACFLAYARADPCNIVDSVNITDGVFRDDGTVLHNKIVYDEFEIFKVNDGGREETRGCPCIQKRCARKCCPQGQAKRNNSCVDSRNSLLHPFNPDVYGGNIKLNYVKASEHLNILSKHPSCEDRYVINPGAVEGQNFYLQANGTVQVQQTETVLESFSPDRYCLEVWEDDPEAEVDDPGYNETAWTPALLLLVCFPEPEATLVSAFPVGMIISIPFLIVTFLVYALIPELQNVHGKSLMMYVTGLIIAYAFLSHIQIQGTLGRYMSPIPCTAYSLIVYFAFMFTFFWLNVMCIDIWLTFRELRASAGRRTTKSRRFIVYCIYAFGGPIIMTCVVAGLNFHPDPPTNIVLPRLGKAKCWFYDKPAELRYFYSPMIVLVMCNIILFGMTAWKIIQVKKETAMATSENSRHTQFQKDKERLFLYVKLFVVMGVGWVMEWISFLVGGPPHWWIVTDLCNTLQGIFIFFVFVFQKKVKKLIIKRYQVWRYGASTVTTTSTRSRSTVDTDKSFTSQSENNIKLNNVKAY